MKVIELTETYIRECVTDQLRPSRDPSVQEDLLLPSSAIGIMANDAKMRAVVVSFPASKVLFTGLIRTHSGSGCYHRSEASG